MALLGGTGQMATLLEQRTDGSWETKCSKLKGGNGSAGHGT